MIDFVWLFYEFWGQLHFPRPWERGMGGAIEAHEEEHFNVELLCDSYEMKGDEKNVEDYIA